MSKSNSIVNSSGGVTTTGDVNIGVVNGDRGSSSSSYTTIYDKSICSDHNLLLKYICSCSSCIPRCQECMIDNHTGDGHDMIELPERMKEVKRELFSYASEMKKLSNKYKKMIQESKGGDNINKNNNTDANCGGSGGGGGTSTILDKATNEVNHMIDGIIHDLEVYRHDVIDSITTIYLKYDNEILEHNKCLEEYYDSSDELLSRTRATIDLDNNYNILDEYKSIVEDRIELLKNMNNNNNNSKSNNNNNNNFDGGLYSSSLMVNCEKNVNDNMKLMLSPLNSILPLPKPPLPISTTVISSYEIGECMKTLSGHSSYVYSVFQLSNGHVCSCSADNTIKIWNIDAGECIKTLSGHNSTVCSLIQLSNGHVCSGSGDRTIKIWNIDTGECMNTLSGHSDSVYSVIQLCNGQLCSGSHDNTIKIWKMIL